MSNLIQEKLTRKEGKREENLGLDGIGVNKEQWGCLVEFEKTTYIYLQSVLINDNGRTCVA
jgi:hypothetical protein